MGETPKYRKDDEDKFKVDKNLNGLWQYLTKRNIDMETFAELLVKGKKYVLDWSKILVVEIDYL